MTQTVSVSRHIPCPVDEASAVVTDPPLEGSIMMAFDDDQYRFPPSAASPPTESVVSPSGAPPSVGDL